MATKTRGQQTIETIKQFIRYDIPMIINGASSIGKSFTIIELTKIYRVKNQLLYIGSEKPENIEGLPKLHQEGEMLTYFKPYWFPKSDYITKIVTNGRALFEKYLAEYHDQGKKFKYNYAELDSILEDLATLDWGQDKKKKEVSLVDFRTVDLGKPAMINTKPFPFEREIPTKEITTSGAHYRDDIRDMCAYLCTLLGYGNFWLILDELDKVEDFDIDKYAPLLHIVRERQLKTWNLIEINDGKGINIPSLVKAGNYKPVKDIIDTSIRNGQSLLDTRVIGIANKTREIEHALFRRFVQIIVEDLLILRPNSLSTEQNALRSCLDSEGVTGNQEIPPMQMLQEVNLQWVFNFLVKMINKNDMVGNFLYIDALEAIKKVPKSARPGTARFSSEAKTAMETTAIFKVLRDNYEDPETRDKVLKCLTSIMVSGISGNISEVAGENELNARARKHVEEISKGDPSETNTAFEILNFLQEQYPETSTDESGAAIKIQAVNQWVALCYSYLYATMFAGDGEFYTPQRLISEILIPRITQLIMQQITLDDELSMDQRASIMLTAGEWWKERQHLFANIMGDPQHVKHALYASDPDHIPVYGHIFEKGKGLPPVQQTLMNMVSDKRNNGALITWLKNSTANEIMADMKHFESMRHAYGEFIKNKLIPFWRNQNRKAYTEAADKLEILFA